MPRRVFKRLVSNHRSAGVRWYLKPFRRLLDEHGLWSTHRRSVVPAFALGLFLGLLPLPGHMIFAGIAALYLRINLPVAVIATLVTNPLTIGPLLYLDYRVGAYVLGLVPQPLEIEWTLEWFRTRLVDVWKPMLVGSLVVAPLGAALGYGLLTLIWRVSTGLRFRRRRRSPQRET